MHGMKRVAFVLVGASLVLTATLSASAARRHANATHVQQAEKCIRAALRKEDLALKYIKEGNLSDEAIANKVIEPAIEVELKCAMYATLVADALDEISPAESKAVREDLHAAQGWDAVAHTDLTKFEGVIGRHNIQKAISSLEHADGKKHKALAALEKATAPPPPPPPPPPVSGTFTIALGHIFGAGPSSTNDCETVTVNETGFNVIPTGTLNLTGPGGFNGTNTLTFTPSGTGVFVAPSTFLFTAFGPYTENASITVNGTNHLQTGSFTLDASNDTTTAGCSVP